MPQQRSTACAVSLATLALLLCSAGSHAALQVGTENISGQRTAGDMGQYGWNYSYQRSFNGTAFEKDVQIQFNFDPALNYTQAQKNAFVQGAQAEIASVWDNKWQIYDATTNQYFAINFQITTAGWPKGGGGVTFDQTVEVQQNTGRDDLTHWSVANSPTTNTVYAHEFGHMLGLYDEYTGGATANPAVICDTCLMGNGALGLKPDMPKRYYQQFLDFAMGGIVNPNGDTVQLVPVPEPEAWALLAAGLGLLMWTRRGTRSRA